jgi:hypothetical protein
VVDSRAGGLARIFRTFLDIVLFRQGPEDLPVSQSLLLITIAANLLLGLAFDAALPRPEFNRIPLAIAEVAFVLAWYWALLKVARRPERFLQTATAVFGVSILILPLYTAAQYLVIGHKPDDLPAMVLIFGLVIEVWLIAVNARILQSATQWPIAACVAVMLLRTAVWVVVVRLLFPEALGTIETGPAPPAG